MAEEKGKYYRVQKDYIRAYQGKMERIYLTMRPEEKQAIQAAADAAGMPTSAFVRAAIAEKMERAAESASEKTSTSDYIRRYIEDPSTRVYVYHNNETGRWLYSVCVDGDSLWLASFSTEGEALAYIEKNGLKIVEGENGPD